MDFVFRQPATMNDRRHIPRKASCGRSTGQPGWAKGLRKLYDSVVEEPLPDSFEDLLKKLDQRGDGHP